MQSNREPIESNVESNPVFIPKRMQNQTKNSFVANGYHNQFKHKEISVNGSALPNRFKTKPIKSLKRQSIHTIPVKAEIHQQIEAEAELRAADRQTISANGLTAHRLSADTALSGANNEKSKTMTAIKGILKSKPSSKRAVGGVSGVSDGHASDATEVSASVSATVSSDSDRLQCRQSDHKTHNPSRDLTKKFRSTPSERRTSCSVQFDIHDIKESTRVELNANPRGLTSISSARRESSNSSSSLSIIQQSVPQNPVLTYDFPKSSQRLSDLRKILNPEIEKEDSLKKLGERLIHCDCFELNLNNAAKIITALVLIATLILVLRALFTTFS